METLKSLLFSLHGVFMGVYLFEILTLCAPIFQGRYYRFPSFLLRVPPLVTGFSTTFFNFVLTLCFLVSLPFSVVNFFLYIYKDGRVALSHWEKVFKMKCKKLNHPLAPNPWPIYEFFPDF